MNAEALRLKENAWKNWGPYVSDRQWGTVREDYSSNGDAWSFTTHDMARSKTYRWGEEGIAGICDKDQLLCFAVSLWNKKDPFLKERYYGLSNTEGNHGEDVKELYYYLDNTPTHSYMKMLYKYPQQEFPYQWLVDENKRRTKNDPEFELTDTGIFNENKYFDIFVEYAKKSPDDILIKLTIHNHSNEDAHLNILPTLWFRNTWAWGESDYKPQLTGKSSGIIEAFHKDAGYWRLSCEGNPEILVCDNETNTKRLYHNDDGKQFYKDGINDYIVHKAASVNPKKTGTKASADYDITVKAHADHIIRLRLTQNGIASDDFEETFNLRRNEADIFYNTVLLANNNADARKIQRQAFAGLLWNKQFYYFNVNRWLEGDAGQTTPPRERLSGRNTAWKHINSKDIISMPDKWEFPWFAAWDLAFHCLPLAKIDSEFAKQQLLLLTKEWYMHPNGHLPAYEWNFSDVNPPVHALATWLVYLLDKEKNKGMGDLKFLEKVFHKLMLNFTWWVNRNDANGSNIFEGGFLGLDNIGVFDRNMHLPDGVRLEQADATSWMAMFTLNLLRIAVELSDFNDVYEDIATKFFEHFLYIAGAMSGMDLWNEEENFYYDRLRYANGESLALKIRSIIGFIPFFAVEVLDDADIRLRAEFFERLKWFSQNRPDLAGLVSGWLKKNKEGKHLISILNSDRMKKILKRMLDEKEFLSEYGVRSLSKYHLDNPYLFSANGNSFAIQYVPGESNTDMYGGNSNWRGPVWLPFNFLIIETLRRFHLYHGDDFKVECPTGSGRYMNLSQVADELGKRLATIFVKDKNGNRAVFGNDEQLQADPHFSDYILFHEYFHGDSGKGLGASHQTGWTGLIIRYLFDSTS
ncbi:MAG: glucosidase [Chitinophagaceae bacterium]|nr:MAG: glucosidase [Chitinophagaceae bacterium]